MEGTSLKQVIKTPKKTPTADRFIPNRSAMNMEVSHFNLSGAADKMVLGEANQTCSPSKKQYHKNMVDTLFDGSDTAKILAFKKKAPAPKDGYQNSLRVLYSQNKTSGAPVKKSIRHIPQAPDRILDAPELLDDYYLNLLDWSSQNTLAVALGRSIYLWNANNGTIQELTTLADENAHVSAVSWVADGQHLAVGTSEADVQLWDVEHLKQVRNMKGHTARVGSLSWNNYILSSGARSGNIHNHDVRVARHHQSTFSGHEQEVCGLKWSPDGSILASGGNDNKLNLWELGSTSTKFTLTHHTAAVKALAWCPWQSSLLASGGGTADRTIRFWNCNTGACVNSVDTKSQVCSLLWSKEHRELVSSHGYSQNQLIIWKYPSLVKTAELTGHSARVLHLAASPDGSTVVSAGADETLRFWKCFASDSKRKAKKALGGPASASMRGMIR